MDCAERRIVDQVITTAYDPCSTTQTNRLVALVRTLIDEHPSLAVSNVRRSADSVFLVSLSILPLSYWFPPFFLVLRPVGFGLNEPALHVSISEWIVGSLQAGGNKAMQQLLAAVVKKLENAVDQDVFIPFHFASKSLTFVNRQFWSAAKLLRNMLHWQVRVRFGLGFSRVVFSNIH